METDNTFRCMNAERIARMETLVDPMVTLVPKLARDMAAIKWSIIGGLFTYVAQQVGILEAAKGIIL